MKKRFSKIAIAIFFIVLFFAFNNDVKAQGCTLDGRINSFEDYASFKVIPNPGVDFSISTKVEIYCSATSRDDITEGIEFTSNNDRTLSVSFKNETTLTNGTAKDICVFSDDHPKSEPHFKKQSGIRIFGGNSNSVLCDYQFTGGDVYYQPTDIAGTTCNIETKPNPPNPGQTYQVLITNIPTGVTNAALYRSYQTSLEPTGGTSVSNLSPPSGSYTANAEDVDKKIIYSVFGTINGIYRGPERPMCQVIVDIGGDPTQDSTSQSNTLISTDICQFAGEVNTPPRNDCVKCVTVTKGIWTALGCIPANPQDFVASLLRIAIGIAGGIAFLMIIYGGFQIMISSGNPEKLNNGKEIVTSAIAGLLLIIFSVIILKIIGVDVLGIPGLTG